MKRKRTEGHKKVTPQIHIHFTRRSSRLASRDNTPKRIKHDEDPAQSFDQELSTSVNQDLSTSFDQELTGSTSVDQELNTSVDQELSTSVDQELSTSVDQELSTSVDQELSRSVDQELSTSVDQELSTSVDQELSTSVDQELSTSVDQELSTSVDQELSTSVNQDLSMSFYQESSVNSGELSQYEKKRLENIKKNEEMMKLLNFKQATHELRLLKDSNSKRPWKRKPASLEPIRRSARIKGVKTIPKYTYTFEPIVSAPEPTRKPSGPIEIVPSNDIPDSDSRTFLNNLGTLSSRLQDDDIVDQSLLELASAERYKEMISKLHVLPKNVAKIVPSRICSMAFHPSSSTPIICAGDRLGSIGFWNVESKRESNNGIFVYEPHTDAVSSLSFHPERNNSLFSSSYDGTVRCADFNTCTFQEVYSSDDYIKISGLSYPCSSREIIVLACSDGYVTIVDTREKKSTSSMYACHQKAVKCVHCSPTNQNLFCTTSADASVALWDIRRIKNHKSKLDSVCLSRCVSSAYFSPVSGNQILATSYDDYVNVFDLTSSLKLVCNKTFRHYNQTGRYLTPFKATWDPRNDCGIVVGSMLSPRRVQIYHPEQSGRSPFVELFNDNYTTITSINVFHNTRNILASGNSSGKVYIWTEKH